MTRIATGYEALALAEKDLNVGLHKHADPLEDARGVTLAEAQGLVHLDPSLLYATEGDCTIGWRVYRSPEGCAREYCGQFDALDAAQREAEQEPRGLPESLWATARAAGHCDGMEAPGGGEEDEDAHSWHGRKGWHCVVRVRGMA